MIRWSSTRFNGHGLEISPLKLGVIEGRGKCIIHDGRLWSCGLIVVIDTHGSIVEIMQLSFFLG